MVLPVLGWPIIYTVPGRRNSLIILSDSSITVLISSINNLKSLSAHGDFPKG